MKKIKSFIVFIMCIPSYLIGGPYVTSHLMGQFGNQLFIMAAAISLALDNEVEYTFPELLGQDHDPTFNIPVNFQHVFYRFPTCLSNLEPSVVYHERNFTFDPIPYAPNTILFGWFQSEKYFKNHKQEIIELFSAPPHIATYLQDKYEDIIEDEKTVAIHMRTYKIEKTFEQQNAYVTHGKEYIEKAILLFPEDYHFIVFSNDLRWCKQELNGINRNLRFIENEPHYHDFYLMSFCRHQIISNSSFSWWAAYLNTNLEKRVIVPPKWFSDHYVRDTKDLIPSDWIILK